MAATFTISKIVQAEANPEINDTKRGPGIRNDKIEIVVRFSIKARMKITGKIKVYSRKVADN